MRTQRKAHRQLHVAAIAAIALTVPRLLAAQPAANGTGAIVAFVSSADVGFGAPPAGLQAIYVRDQITGQLSRVGECACAYPLSLSLDGTRLAFRVDGPAAISAAYVKGAPFTGQPIRVDVGDDGSTDADGTLTGVPVLSGNGRFVAFASTANLDRADGDTPGTPDLFVRDLVAGRTQRWTLGARLAGSPSISADGRYVAFATPSQLLPEDSNQVSDVYLLDRRASSSNLRLLTDPALNAAATGAAIAAGGSAVAFTSAADNLAPGDSNGSADVFVVDLRAGTTTRVSVSAGAGIPSSFVSISGNGRRVLFAAATRLYLYDLNSRETTPIDSPVAGAPDLTAALSPDGHTAFLTAPGTTTIVTIPMPPDAPAGSGVRTDPFDPVAGQNPLTLTLAKVTAPGNVSLTIATAGPAMPAGLRAVTPYFSVTADAGTEDGALVCLAVSETTSLATALRLLRFDGATWVDEAAVPGDQGTSLCGHAAAPGTFIFASRVSDAASSSSDNRNPASASTGGTSSPASSNIVTWNVDANGFWDVPTNWSGGVVPGDGDTVIIDRPSGTFVVTVRTTTANVQSVQSAEQLTVTGTLVVSGTASFDGGLILSGTVTGTGSATLGPSNSWVGGPNSVFSLTGGVTVPAGRALTIGISPGDFPNHYLIDSSLHVHGAVIWTYGAVTLSNSGVTVESDGLWEADNDLSLTSDANGVRTFTNLGTLRKATTGGALTLGGTIAFANSGTIDLQAGTISISSSSGLINNGFLKLAAGTAFQLDKVTLQAGSTFAGPGQLQANGATIVTGNVTVTAPLLITGQVTGTGTLHLDAAATWQSNGTTIISVAGGVDVMAGRTLTISAAPNQLHYLIDSSLHSSGTVVWTSGGLLLSGSTVTNEVGGLWDIQADVSVGSQGAGSPAFTNFGTLRKSAGPGTLTLGGSVVYTNTGTIDVQSGVLAVGGQQLTSSGVVQVATGVTVQLDRVTLQNGSTFGGPGLLHANGLTTIGGDVTITTPLLITGEVTGSGTLRLSAATTWQSNGTTIISVAGGVDVMAGQTLTVAAAPGQLHYLIDSALRNHGTVVWTGGPLLLRNNSTAVNDAGRLWDTQGDLSIISDGTGSPAFTNFGTLRKSAGPGTLTLGGTIVYTNTGTIDLQTGVLTVSSGGGLNTNGLLQLGSGTTFQLDHVTLQASSTFSGTGLLHANGFTTIPGTVTVTAPLLITGEVTGTGTLRLSAATTWQSNGTTIIGVAGGVDVLAGQTLLMSSAPGQLHYLINSSLRNHGTVVWTGGPLLLRNSSTAVNDAGRLWDSQGDFSIISDGIGSPAFTNLGTLRKSAGPGTLTLGGTIVYTNTGTIDLQTGVLTVSSGGGLNTSGPLQLGTGTTFQLDRVTLQASSTFSGTGLLHANGLTTIAGTVTVTAPLLITGEVTGTGALRLSAATTWQSNGTTIISAAGGVDVLAGQTLLMSSAPGQLHYLINSSLHNHGTVVWTGGALLLRNGSPVVNEAGRLWDAQGDLSIVSDGIGSPAFTNLGTLRKSAGPGTLTLGGTIVYTNTGTIDLQTGVLTVSSGGGLNTSGPLQLGSGTTFQVDHVTLLAGSTFSGTGLLHANGLTTVSGTVTVTAPLLITGEVTGTGTLRLSAAATWQSNGTTIISVAGGVEVMADRTLTLSAAPGQLHYLIDSSLRNHGTVAWTSGGLQLRNSSSVTNETDGIWDVQASLSVGFDGSGTPVFVNNGVLRRSGAPNRLTIAPPFTNTGTFAVRIGGLGAGQLDEFGSGAVNLNGTLSAQLINGFTPGAGDQFKVMDYPSISGAFATLTGDGITFSACYTPTALFVCSVSTVKLTPTITWANPADIPFGTALGATQLNATASVPGTFVYTPAAGVILNAGNNQSLQLMFTPADTVHYNTATASVSINVVRATPVITWANAASIVYGVALSGTQLNATASVPGTFVYTPAAGVKLHAGNSQQLSVAFTPTDTANYQPAGKSVTISVLRAPLTVAAANANKVFGAPLPTFTASFNGFVNGDTSVNLGGTLSFTTTATATSPVGGYPIVPGGLSSPDYTIAFQSGTLTIAPAATQTSIFVLPATVGFLQPVYAIAVVAPVAPGAGVPAGVVQFKEGASLLGSATVTSNIAYLVLNGLAPGGHNITAAYGGSSNFAASLSSAGSATVRPVAASTFTFFVAQTNPQASGQPATLVAAVIPLGGGTPTGTVQFMEGNTVVGSAAIAGGVATINTTTLTVGTHLLSARYLGNAAFAATSSPPAAITIYSGARPTATASSLTSSAGTSALGAPVTFTATVTGGATSGTVSFYSDGVPIGDAPLALAGGSFKATLTTAVLSTGIHVVSASYLGSAGFSSSTSGPVVQVVQAP